MALAAETLSGCLLAWMSIRASVTLTVILLPWAPLSFRGSASFAWMTLAMLAMLWRGEAWETVFLHSKQQALELQQRQQLRTSSKIRYPTPDSFLAYGDVRRVLPRASFQIACRTNWSRSSQSPRVQSELNEDRSGFTQRVVMLLLIATGSGLAICPAKLQSPHVPESDELPFHSQGGQFSGCELELPEPIRPNSY